MRGPYDEMLHLPHHRSAVHPPLTMQQRAAQFAPFSALTGYEAVVAEQARRTEEKPVLDETEQARLNECLRAAAAGDRPWRFTWFVPDRAKEGGACVTCIGTVRRLDPAARTLELTDRTRIPLAELVAISPADGL